MGVVVSQNIAAGLQAIRPWTVLIPYILLLHQLSLVLLLSFEVFNGDLHGGCHQILAVLRHFYCNTPVYCCSCAFALFDIDLLLQVERGLNGRFY